MGRVALGRTGRRCDNILVAVGMGTIIVMDVGVFQRVISDANCNAIPRRLSTGEIYICERSAARESPITNARHTVRNRHVCQRCATSESGTDNACHAVRDCHACQRAAVTESVLANARHAVRERHAGQRCAIIESVLANVRHAVRDRHTCKRFAIIESIIANTRHAVRDRTCRKCARALHQSCLIFAEQNTGCIAGVMTVALSDPYTGQSGTIAECTPADACHTVRNRHTCQRCAFRESVLVNACHTVRDRHTCKRFAINESTIANTRHTVRDRHACQRAAVTESVLVNACHTARNRHACQRFAIMESKLANARHAVRDRHAGQRCAAIESVTDNACHTVWDRHAGQRCAAIESVTTNARHGHTFDRMRNIGFGNGRIAIGNGSCLFIEREIAAFHSIFHFPTAFTAVVSGCRFPGISFVSALTYPITTVRMRRFVLRTAVSMLLCDGHVTCILQPQLHILSLMICTNFIHNVAVTHNGIARRIRSRAITKICKACRICRIAIQIDHARRELDFTSAINCLLNGQSRIRCHCSAARRGTTSVCMDGIEGCVSTRKC